MVNKRIRVALIVLMALSLAQCGVTRQGAPVHGIRPSTAAHGGTHRVTYGETLYSIAWNYGVDPQQIAAINRIDSPYTIYSGQVLRLQGKPLAVEQRVVASNNKVRKPSVPITATPTLASQWVWPAKGKVITRYKSNTLDAKGIDIAGPMGASVLAANHGRVVYAGEHLRGYGKVILIQHANNLVSAYAHNSRNLVTVGQEVSAGQAVAQMGSTGTNRVKLHFEIRQSGKPVDPLNFLRS